MKFHDTSELALRNLRQSILRNSLTTLGISVGVASLVAMLSLGIGLQQTFNKRFARSGLFDRVLVMSKRDMRFGPEHNSRNREPIADARALDDAARAEIAKLPNVIEVFPEIRFFTEVRFGDKGYAAGVAGLPQSARTDAAFETMKGKFFSGPQAGEAVLLNDFAKDLDPTPANLVGKEIVIRYAERQAMQGGDDFGYSIIRREQKLRVVGITDQEPNAGMRGMHSGVYLPIELAEKLNMMQGGDLRGMLRDAKSPDQRTYQALNVRVSSPTAVEQVEEAIKKAGFNSVSLMDAMRNMRRVFAVLDLFLGIFGSLALAVASLGIINTLVMAILERRREIGIMKAIGASDGDVRKLFFAEAISMGVIGGFGGVLLGWGIGRAINFATMIYLRRQQIPAEDIWSVPWWLVLGAIGFSAIVTLVAGLYPSGRAAKLDPIQALRYE